MLLRILFLSLTAMISAPFAGASPPHSTFRTMNSSEPRSLDPIVFTGATLLLAMYETLYEYDYLSDPLTVKPLLAEALPKFSADGLVVTIPIRQGIRFWDDPCFKATQGKGRELTAEDVALTLKRLAVPQLAQGWWLVNGKIKGINGLRERLQKGPKSDYLKILAAPVEGIRALDRHTLQLTLTQPYPQLVFGLAVMVAAVVPVEALAAYASEDGELLDHPVGTGPFRLREWVHGQRLLLDRNHDYHPDTYPSQATGRFHSTAFLRDQGKNLPLVEHVSIDIVREESTAWLKFLADQLDVIRAPKEQLHLLGRSGGVVKVGDELAAKKIVADVGPANGVITLAFNMRDPLLGKNKFLRQALSSAIDRNAWNAIFYEKLAVPATAPLPPGVAGRPAESALKFGFDQARAKTLLEKAGYPGGKGLPALDLELGEPGTTNRQLAEFLTRQLAAIGVELRVSMSTLGVFQQKRNAAQLQIFLDGWTLDYPDPENLYSILYGPNHAPGTNASNFQNKEFDELYLQMAKLSPGAARSRLIQKMDAIFAEEAPWILIVYPSNVHLLHSRVRNYRYDEILWNQWKYVNVEGN